MLPIQRLIALNPTSAVIITYVPGEYDPASEEDFQPGSPVYWPVVGAFSGVKFEGDNFVATLTIDADDMPNFFAIGASRVGVQEGEYGVKFARGRRAFGEISGWTLELTP